MSASELLRRRDGGLGRITLNRPAALNALSSGMVEAIDAALADWEADPSVRCVLIDGAGERGLCAGGDIRAMREDVLSGRPERTDRFLAREYALNARIARFPKPFVAFMDGVVMGGGVGVSAHGAMRIVTGRTRLAMPEVGIGFLPDVGASWLLSRAPGRLGLHAALTGAALSPFDAIACGLADRQVASDRLPALADALRQCGDLACVARAVAALEERPAPEGFAVGAGWIDACYAADDVAGIVAALRAHPEPAAEDAARRIAAACPTSVAVALRALRLAPALGGLEPCLELERRLAATLVRRPDFAEGVRAAVVDKDRAPRWAPAMDAASLDALFARAADGIVP